MTSFNFGVGHSVVLNSLAQTILDAETNKKVPEDEGIISVSLYVACPDQDNDFDKLEDIINTVFERYDIECVRVENNNLRIIVDIGNEGKFYYGPRSVLTEENKESLRNIAMTYDEDTVYVLQHSIGKDPSYVKDLTICANEAFRFTVGAGYKAKYIYEDPEDYEDYDSCGSLFDYCVCFDKATPQEVNTWVRSQIYWVLGQLNSNQPKQVTLYQGKEMPDMSNLEILKGVLAELFSEGRGKIVFDGYSAKIWPNLKEVYIDRPLTDEMKKELIEKLMPVCTVPYSQICGGTGRKNIALSVEIAKLDVPCPTKNAEIGLLMRHSPFIHQLTKFIYETFAHKCKVNCTFGPIEGYKCRIIFTATRVPGENDVD